MSILVAGGAGYIGSHVVRHLLDEGRKVVVVDNLLGGHRDALPADVPFLQADISDRSQVTRFLVEQRVEAVLHFAARIQVGESVVNPRLYMTGNLGASIAFLESILDAGVRRVVFSSTAAVYGNPQTTPIAETHPTVPINPYGMTKLAIESILRDYSAAYGIGFVALRYFNACGAEAHRGLGERHEPESHLIPIVLDAVSGRRPSLTIYGDDYPTPDGTCVRDYIHVTDLATAHLAALAHLERGGAPDSFNLGTGEGRSVREVIAAVELVTGKRVPVVMGQRRDGDPPFLVAAAKKAERVLGFRARVSSLERIVRDAWDFHQLQPRDRDSRPSSHAIENI